MRLEQGTGFICNFTYYSCTLKSIVEIHYTENKINPLTGSDSIECYFNVRETLLLICIRFTCKFTFKLRTKSNLLIYAQTFLEPVFGIASSYWLHLDENRITSNSPFSINQPKYISTRIEAEINRINREERLRGWRITVPQYIAVLCFFFCEKHEIRRWPKGRLFPFFASLRW